MSTATAPVEAPKHAVPTAGEMEVPCHLIVADPKFNARHFLDGQGKDGTTVEDLARTIKLEGQLSAVQVKPRSDGKYDLIFGFRRFAAISWPKDKGGLGLPTIRATFVEEGASEMDLYYRNLIENVARQNLTPYDLAARCAMLQKGGEKGTEIAKRIGKGTSYINDLIRYFNDLHPEIIARWKEEHSPTFEHTRTQVLTTDNLRKLCGFKRDDGKTPDRDAQVVAFHEMMVANKEREAPKTEGADGSEATGGGEAQHSVAAKRPGLVHLRGALEAAEVLKKHGKGYTKVIDKDGKEKVTQGKALDKEETTRVNTVIEVLQWAMASKIKPGQTNSIKGVYQYKDGE